jgi:superfamily II DNA or RNA helicase
MTALYSTSNVPAPLQVKVRIDSAVRLNVQELQKTHRKMLERVKGDLVLANPEYVKLKRLGKTGWGVPHEIQLYEFDRETKDLVLPRGYAERLLGQLCSENVIWDAEDCRVSGTAIEFPRLPVLRDYQEEPVYVAVDQQQGVIEAPTGAGKTIMGLAIVGRAGRKALWITHTRDLADQAMTAAREQLGLNDGQLGLIGGGSQTVGTHLTVGMVQALIRKPLPECPGLEDVGVVILDEAHHCPADTFQAVVATSPARYRIGLTATPKRADGMEPVLYAVIGPTLARVTNQTLAASGQVIRPTIIPVRTGLAFEYPADAEYDKPKEQGQTSPKLPAKHARYNRMTSEIIRSGPRNRMICDLVRREYEAGHSCLVLSPFISHLETLFEMLSVWCSDRDSIRLLTGQHALPAQRARVLEQARQRQVRIILATQLADEGLDVPCLDRLFLAMPKRAASKAVQQVGRIMRPAPGKVDAVVYDFVDLVGILLSQWKVRRKAYLDRGFEVREMEVRS